MTLLVAPVQFRSEGADTQNMLPTWSFQRGVEQLKLHCRESRRGVTLVVSGDGDLRSYSFRDYAALVKFESEMEEFLLETGWTPTELTIEQRPVRDRTLPPENPAPDAATKGSRRIRQ